MAPSELSFRNRTAIFGWGIALLFLAGCAIFTWLLVRDGPGSVPINPPNHPGHWPAWFMLLVLFSFWAAGLGALAHVASIPCVRVELAPGSDIRVVRRYLFRTDRFSVPCTAAAPAMLVEETDGDGDPYYRVLWSARDGDTLALAEGHDRERCQSVCERFNAGILA